MSQVFQPLIALLLAALCGIGEAAVLRCPPAAPQDWKAGPSPLVDVQVLSYPAGEKIDYSGTLPLMAPDRQTQKNGITYQTWFMNTDAPKFTFEFLCVYKNIDHKLPVPAPDVSRCVMTFTAKKKVLGFRCS
jgi:hypothetical protein